MILIIPTVDSCANKVQSKSTIGMVDNGNADGFALQSRNGAGRTDPEIMLRRSISASVSDVV